MITQWWKFLILFPLVFIILLCFHCNQINQRLESVSSWPPTGPWKPCISKTALSLLIPQLPHTVTPSFCPLNGGTAVTVHLVPEAETWIFFIPSPVLPKLSRRPDLIYFLSVPQIHSPFSPNYCWLVLSLLLVINLNRKFFLRNLLSLFCQVIVCSWLCLTDSQKNPWVTSFPMYASGMKKLVFLRTVTELFAHGVPAANRVCGFSVLP